MTSIELFTGAGGLAYGSSLAGFSHVAVVERDHDCCETMRFNKQRGIEHIRDWNIIEKDVREFDYSDYSADFIAGGVPCQPFSLAGKHKAHEDVRDMFPEFARAVATVQPKAFLVENVKGLLRPAFADYFEYVVLRLSHPTVTIEKDEPWRDHRSRLEKIHTSGTSTGLDYHVVFQLLNAADYGVPQKRERVLIVGFRSDLAIRWSFPKPTHSQDALLRSQWVTGEYWERHKIAKKDRPNINERHKIAVRELETPMLFGDDTLPWRTVRDAIGDLPRLKSGETDPDDDNHFLNPGARPYPGHTGSPWDEPAKCLKAGDHGVPGGENTLAYGNGEIRYFSVRECARIQTFPDSYRLTGAWTERMRQLGNAVPVELAHAVAGDIAKHLVG